MRKCDVTITTWYCLRSPQHNGAHMAAVSASPGLATYARYTYTDVGVRRFASPYIYKSINLKRETVLKVQTVRVKRQRNSIEMRKCDASFSGFYWLRSPRYDSSDVEVARPAGYYTYADYYDTTGGVRLLCLSLCV